MTRDTNDAPTRVLLVDDDAAFRSVYAKLLGKDYAVDLADDRPSATALFERHAYAVVLLDLMLPPDGTVAAGNAQLTALLTRRPDAKVIVVSGAGDAPVLLQAIPTCCSPSSSAPPAASSSNASSPP